MIDVNEKLLLDADGTPLDHIGGFETEYGFSIQDANGEHDAFATASVARQAVHLARRKEFFEEGQRFYWDIGDHPEFATAEEISYLGAAFRLLNGHIQSAERISNIAESLRDNPSYDVPIGIVNLIANTHDGHGETWGSHESLLTKRSVPFSSSIKPLAIHRATRIIWSGAGNVVHAGLNGFRYELSEKAPYILDVSNALDCRHRPLVHMRDQALADPDRFRRVHNVSGETVYSPLVNALRLGSEAILHSALELGVSFDDLWLEDPVAAIHEISADTTLRRRVKLADGREFTAIDLQREIAERSFEAVRSASYLTLQEEFMAYTWFDFLDGLESDPQSHDSKFDWVAKLKLIDKAVASEKRKPGISDYAVAWKTAIEYHRLLPYPGYGMRLIRAGAFDMSPTEEELDIGLPLPENRAHLRGKNIKKLTDAKKTFQVDWHYFCLQTGYGYHEKKVHMDDPYSMTNDQLEDMVDELVTAV